MLTCDRCPRKIAGSPAMVVFGTHTPEPASGQWQLVRLCEPCFTTVHQLWREVMLPQQPQLSATVTGHA